MATTTDKRPCRVVLVRHGTTPTTGAVLPGRAAGLHLSDRGREQAEAVAEALADADIAAVYSSPLERARETAAVIAKRAGCRPLVRAGLNECDFGEWTGSKLSNLRRRSEWSSIQNRPSTFRFPGGESFVEMQRRIVDTLTRLAADHPGDTIVATSHADPIKAALCYFAGSHLDHFQRFVVAPCSTSVVWLGDNVPVVESANVPPRRGAHAGVG